MPGLFGVALCMKAKTPHPPPAYGAASESHSAPSANAVLNSSSQWFPNPIEQRQFCSDFQWPMLKTVSLSFLFLLAMGLLIAAYASIPA